MFRRGALRKTEATPEQAVGQSDAIVTVSEKVAVECRVLGRIYFMFTFHPPDEYRYLEYDHSRRKKRRQNLPQGFLSALARLFLCTLGPSMTAQNNSTMNNEGSALGTFFHVPRYSESSGQSFWSFSAANVGHIR